MIIDLRIWTYCNWTHGEQVFNFNVLTKQQQKHTLYRTNGIMAWLSLYIEPMSLLTATHLGDESENTLGDDEP